MPTHRIETAVDPRWRDPTGEALAHQLQHDLGIEGVSVRVVRVYTLALDLSANELAQAANELFRDPVNEITAVDGTLADRFAFDTAVEVGFRPGVTDNVGKTALEGLRDMVARPFGDGAVVYSGRLFLFAGMDAARAETIAGQLLANTLIEQFAVASRDALGALDGAGLLPLPVVRESGAPTVDPIALGDSDEALLKTSRDGVLALDLGEMHAIRDYYARVDVQAERKAIGLPVEPTDVELEAIAQTWSEHCKHKIFAARIRYDDGEGTVRHIDGLFRTYIRAATKAIAEKADWLASVFHDNAGLVRFDEHYLFALKCETHNSPSALDPYGGAMTGIVGVNRDILGAGLGCRCIFNTDVFCFAPPDYAGDVPERLMHPRRVLRGVHAGVRDGGNQSGIPTVNGAIAFHERFLGKPLVFCGTGGLVPAKIGDQPAESKCARPGDRIFMVGGRIGKDGIHGATFSSEALHQGSPATAVQIGDPITQRKMQDFLLEARDRNLYSCITDNGAGGLSSSIGEMARDAGGAVVHLDRAPLKYAGLRPWEIFLSEAQERMTIAVPPERCADFLALAKRRDVEASDLGEYVDSGRLECRYNEAIVASVRMDFLHDGCPRMELEARWKAPRGESEDDIESPDLTADLLRVLGRYNVCSKETFVRMYDHEVQGQTVIKPFQGPGMDGPGDAGVVRPLPGSTRGIAIACGLCPQYSDLDTHAMMQCAVDEAVRNLVAVGAPLDAIAGLDNFCWPDPVQSASTPDGDYKLAQLVRCCEALYDMCTAYRIPLISGKDSMKNDYRIGGTKISIPPTVLFTAAAIMPDVRKALTMDVKAPGHAVYVVGETRAEMGGSEYLASKGRLGHRVPRVLDPALHLDRFRRLHEAIADGLVASCHDCSEGGLGVALAESAFAGDFGMELELDAVGIDSPTVALFSETPGRFVATVPEPYRAAFENTLQADARFLGLTTETAELRLSVRTEPVLTASLDELRQAWQAPFANY